MRLWLFAFLVFLTTASVTRTQADLDPVFIDSVWAQQSDNYPTDVQQENDGVINIPPGNKLAELEIFDPNSYYAELEQSDDDDGDGLSEIEEDGEGYFDELNAILQQQGYDDNQGGTVEIEQYGDDNDEVQAEEEDEDENEAIEQEEDEVFNELQALLQEEDDSEEDSTAVAQWNNKLDGPIKKECRPGQGLYKMRSIYSKDKKDRLFSFGCKKVSSAKPSSIQLLRIHRPSIRKIRGHFKRLGKRIRKRFRHHQKKMSRKFRKMSRSSFIKTIRKYHYDLRKCQQKQNAGYKKIYRLLLRLYRLALKKKASRSYRKHTGCAWKAANQLDKPMSYSCPANKYLAGIFSRHDNKNEDRVWYMYCCSTPGMCTKSCKWSGFINKMNGPMNYKTKGIITGLYSLHDNKTEDRKWKVRSCSMQKC